MHPQNKIMDENIKTFVIKNRKKYIKAIDLLIDEYSGNISLAGCPFCTIASDLNNGNCACCPWNFILNTSCMTNRYELKKNVLPLIDAVSLRQCKSGVPQSSIDKRISELKEWKIFIQELK